ncbi:3-beta hydroxysteroid dehydrogenase [Loigolactobacillus backii]|uniref:3-beta hydroxysteroid dehydrogenase n=1 Tax=Loigolactobacillus backii TaxID=375175 RepID=A0A192H1Y1_9LACO|nr:NAD-dependent epimerase/dehydratase family protein [Loigolactobacillus backii]ANK62370.1 3-beta hydroxysteroid dehydrogenase [Loigolactobacillus backii]ANK70618.1 3-beta hydroxysteroid dehydrogenase [Loigolactobacillus backii]
MNNNVLVTGGNGFLSMQLILQLLKQGYSVRATLRSLEKKATVINTLKANSVINLEKLSFVKADLTSDAGWEEAMHNVTYVLSVASPMFSASSKNKNGATEGILRILKQAQTAHVKRVVMTANFGAIGFSNKDKQSLTTEADWTNPNEKGLSAYEKSKLLAEKAAWQYLKTANSKLEFTTVNPVAILGSVLNEHVSDSFGLIKNLIDGSLKRIPNIPLNVVDVRDVVDLHIRAMITPQAKGQRFIASEDGQISLPEIGALIRQKRPQLANQISTKVLPDWIIQTGALVNKQAQEGKFFLDINRNVSNQKAKQVLGWQPLSNNETTILATVDTLLKYDLLH